MLRLINALVPLTFLLAGLEGRVARAQQPPSPPPDALPPQVVITDAPAIDGSREPAERDEIETDRDSFTPATTLAGRRRLIIESAHSFIDNRGVKETHSFPELLLRYGFTERLELRLGWNYEVGGAGNEISGIDAGADDPDAVAGLERESSLSYGLKLRMTDQRRWLPGSAFVLQASTPTSGAPTDTHVVGTYVLGWDLPNRWKLDAALRYGTASEGDDRFNVWAPSVVLKAPIGERTNVHAEYFALRSGGKAENFTRQFFSPGIHYLINEDFEIGVRVGWGLNDQSARFFSNIGVGLRF
jgi:hypothetical protein